MAEKLTLQQRQAINNRGGKLLVSAAAGSGKTKVLVDRLLSYLTDPVQPANLDDFLIITYTKAAAAELRGKIAAKLSERIASEPENRHLQQQMQRLYLAKISTVHGFCADVLREYAYGVDIAPDFRVCDENECVELREIAMKHVLDEAYENVNDDPDFKIFVDTQGLGRSDVLVSQIVEKFYNSAQCHMNPEKWIEKCLENMESSQLQDAGQNVWGSYLMSYLKDYLRLQMDSLERCIQAADTVAEFNKVAALLSSTYEQLKHLCDSQTWDQVVERKNIDFGRLIFPQKHDHPDLAEQIKAVRAQCKNGLTKILLSFSDASSQVLLDLQQASASTRGIVRLMREFSAEHQRLKRRRRVLDFSDLEHKTLDLLLGTSRSGVTKIAREIGARFREVMVDEYQDSNAVQDGIFAALTEGRNNCFMVGDVKQSIYLFRLADPGIFLEKYHRYVPSDQAKPGQGRKVLLSSNFRSGGAVLSAVNDVFRQCMSLQVGGLAYGEEEQLNEGLPHLPLGEPEVELHAIDVQQNTYEEEAAFVAQKIRELLDGSHMVRQGDQLRSAVAGDIVILLRSPGSVGHQFTSALERLGIPCSTGGGQNLLQTAEIMTLRSLLQTISNPRQDIPLLSVLASPIFGFTADDLARIRSKHRNGAVYDALLEDGSEKTQSFLDVIRQLRRSARMNTLARLLEDIINATHMDSLYDAMPGNRHRRENLQTFYQLAVDFETSGRSDLNQFLQHLDSMEAKGLISNREQEAGNSVTVMSIHKSKGLEFPIVFLCGLSRRFNREDLKAQVLCHRELGLGLSVVDNDNRMRYPTIGKRAIATKLENESLSEELRVLYVAMTRARDRLIMTYADQHLENTISDIALRMDLCPKELLTRDVSCPGEWVLQAALSRIEAGALFSLGGRPQRVSVSEIPWRIEVNTVEISETEAASVETVSEEALGDEGKRIADFLSFRYPYEAATSMPSKQTATQLKGRVKDEEAAQNTTAVSKAQRSWRRPSFRESQTQGKTYGNAVHTLLRYVDFGRCSDADGVKQELLRLVREGYLSKEQAKLVNCEKIADFFSTDLGQRIRIGRENILREFKFSVLDDGGKYGDSLAGEKILLQGVVDCALIEPDGITVVDFKTDFVTEETLPEVTDRYRSQVQIYGDALSQIYLRKIKKQYLYFFHLNRLVCVE